jgi:hypothetical protein
MIFSPIHFLQITYNFILHGWKCVPHFLNHWSADGHPGWFHCLAVVNSAAINIGVQVSLFSADLYSFGYIPRNGIVGSYGSSSFSFLRSLHTVFHSGCTSLYFPQQCIRVAYPLHSYQHFLFLFFFIIAILSRVRWNLNVALNRFPSWLKIIVAYLSLTDLHKLFEH